MTRSVVLLAGPPCAGKTTKAKQMATPDMQIVDFDAIARELGSPSRYDHGAWIAPTDAEVKRLIVAISTDDEAQAIVIRAVPNPADRAELAAQLRATQVIVINPGRDACYQRARTDHRPARTWRAIAAWYHRYAPASCDG